MSASPSRNAAALATPSAGSSAAATAPAAKSVTLQISSWLATDPSRVVYEQIFRQYSEVHPTISFDRQVISADYASKLTALLASGSAPDMVETDWAESQPLGEQKVLQSLQPYLQQDKINIGDYVQVALELGRWPQKTGPYFAWYTMLAASPLFYNTAMFQAAGLQPPDESWSWQQLIEVAQKLNKTAASPQETQYGFNLTYFTRTMLYSYGWDFATPDSTKSLLDSQQSIDAMQLWQDLLFKYQVSPPNGDFAKGAAFGPFSTKRLGMEIQGSYQIGKYATVQGLDYDIAIPPVGPAGRLVVVKGAPGHSLPTASPHPAEAWAFLSWWTRNQTPDQVVLPGNLPSKLSALAGWATLQKKTASAPAHIDLIYDIATRYGRPVQVLPDDPKTEQVYLDERASILANKEDAKTGMTWAAQRMNALLQQAPRH